MTQMPPREPSPQKAWFALFVLFGINTMNFYDRQILAAVAEPVRKEWALSDSALGLLGTAFTLVYAAVGVPLGRLSDLMQRSRLLAAGVTVWSLLTAASGAAFSYAALFWTRLGVGVGEASCAPATSSLIGDLYPAAKRARALSVFMLGLPVGIFLSYATSGHLAHHYGWRTPFYVACAPGLLLAALCLFIREPPRGAADPTVAPPDPGRSPYAQVLRIPTLWWIIASGALQTFNMYAVNTFTTAFLSRYHGVDIRQANQVSAVALGAVGIVGLLGGGALSDRVHERRPDGRLLLSAITLFLSAPCIYLALQQPRGAVLGFMTLLGLATMLMFVYYATVYAAIQDVVAPKLRGTAMSIYFFAMYVLGASLGPLGMGMLSDRFARQAMQAAGQTVMAESFRAAGLHQAMHLVPVLGLFVALVLYMASRTVARDMARLHGGG